jgi:hypothetical protein
VDNHLVEVVVVHLAVVEELANLEEVVEHWRTVAKTN